MNNENHIAGTSVGGMASSLISDTEQSTIPQNGPEKQATQAASLNVLHHREGGIPGPIGPAAPTLQFETSNGLLEDLEDSDDDAPRSGEKRSGRRKIKIEYIEDKSRRHITFSKRKAGIMKKAYELSTLTGTQVLLLVASETGHVYTFATPKLQPLITKQEGKNLIQACLNSPDHLQSLPQQSSAASVSAHSHAHHSVVSNLPDYLPSASTYDNEIVEEDLAQGRSASALNVSASHGYLPTGTTHTPPSGGSAAVAAAAAQVFMHSGGTGPTAPQYTNYSQSAGNTGTYWTGPGGAASSTSAMYAPVPNKSQQLHSQQQQQQMYHALMQQQQQQQLYQQYQQQQHQQQQIQKQNPDSNDV